MLKQFIRALTNWRDAQRLKKSPPRLYTYVMVDPVEKRISRPVTFMGRGYLFHSGVEQIFSQFDVVSEVPVWVPDNDHRFDPVVDIVPMVENGKAVDIAQYLTKRNKP